MNSRPLRIAAGAAWLLIVAVLTMVPGEGYSRSRVVVCLFCGTQGVSDAILNLALFLPLGLLVADSGRGAVAAGLAGATISLAIESAQLAIPGRYSGTGDVIWNGVGAAAGVLAYRVVHARVRRALPHAAMAYAWTAGLMFILSGWLLEPLPGQGSYWSFWTPSFGHLARYEGELVQARLNGVPLRHARVPPDSPVGQALSGDWTFELVLRKAPPPASVSPLYVLTGARQDFTVMLGISREDLVWRERLRASEWELHYPDVRVSNALEPVEVGDIASVSVRRRGSDRCLVVQEHSRCDLRFGLGRVWSLIHHPSDLSNAQRRALDFLFTLAIMVPLGFLASGFREAVLAGGVVLALAAVAVVVTPLTLNPVPVFAAMAAGLGTGRLLLQGALAGHPGPT